MGADSLRVYLTELRVEDPRKKCEWCYQPLPNERYHLKICPRCRKGTLGAALGGDDYNPFPQGPVIVDNKGKKYQIIYMSQDK